MAFPTTPILDGFNRLNEGPPPSAQWDSSDLVVISQRMSPTIDTSEPGNYNNIAGTGRYLVAPENANQEIYLTGHVDSAACAANGVGVLIWTLRCRSDVGWYQLLVNLTPADPIYDVDDNLIDYGSFDLIGSIRSDIGLLAVLPPQTFVSGDGIGLSVIDDQITAYFGAGSVTWSVMAQATDSSVTDAGYLEVSVEYTRDVDDPLPVEWTFDNFGGGATDSEALPLAPSNLTAAAYSVTQIDLTWADNSDNETGFSVERSTDWSNWIVIATTDADATAYSDTEVDAGTLYYYRARAFNDAGFSGYSNTASVRLDDFMVTEIANTLIDILADNTDLDGVQLFIRGGNPYSVPQDYSPFVEVIVGEETPVDNLTGAVSTRTYTGLITFTAQMTLASNSDWLAAVGADTRRTHIDSYDVIKRLVMAAQAELQRAAHADLDALTTHTPTGSVVVDEVVTAFRLEGALVYGLEQRDNNYDNFGSISFVVETDRTISEGA